MSRPVEPLQPLRREAADANTPAARLGKIVRAVGGAPVLPYAAQARIVAGLRGGKAASPRSGWRMRPVIIAAAIVAVLIVGLGAEAAMSWIRRVVGGPSPPPPDATTTPLRARVHAPRAAHPIERELRPQLEPAPAPTPDSLPESSSAVTDDRSHKRPRRRGTARAASSTDPSPLAQESRLLARALDQLRSRRDYAGALTTLDAYDARFPKGSLRSEAALARLDAWMAVGDSDAALSLLDRTPIGGPRAAELLVLRGELRAAAGRARDAAQDFDAVLARQAPARLQARALYGRASCRSRLGDSAGSAKDLRDYLGRFPDAPRAAEIRRATAP